MGARHRKNVFDRFGGDPLLYGLNESNRKTIARLSKYLHDQGLIAREPDIESLFVPGSETS